MTGWSICWSWAKAVCGSPPFSASSWPTTPEVAGWTTSFSKSPYWLKASRKCAFSGLARSLVNCTADLGVGEEATALRLS